MKRRVLSLFSGCGGMDLGFEGSFKVHESCVNTYIHPSWVKEKCQNWVFLQETCFETFFANDILPFAKAAWVPFFEGRGRKNETFHLESIVDLVKAAKHDKFHFPEVDVVTGGFPCQDFSVAGKRKGFESDKSHKGSKHADFDKDLENRGLLYKWMREVIKITKPKLFIAENVKGLASLGNTKTIIEDDFRSIDDEGYLVLPARVLYAPDYGIPQSRERIFFIGLNKKHLQKNALNELSKNKINDGFDLYPLKTHTDPQLFEANLKPYVSTRLVLQDLNEPEEEKIDLAQIFYSKAKFGGNTQGQKEINLNGIGPTIRAEHHGNIEYRRLSAKHGGKHIHELNRGLSERRLTVRECARIQTFPDDYMFVRRLQKKDPLNLSASNAYKLIGNAVPPFLAYHIAKRVEFLWPKIFKKDAKR